MKLSFKNNTFFYLLYGCFLIIGLISYLRIPKGAEITYCYQHYNNYSNLFFKNITYFGEFYFAVIFGIYLYFKRRNFLNFAMSAWIGQLLLSKFFKLLIDAPRPLTFFKGVYSFDLIDGVQPLFHQSLPSGHASMAFCTCCLISFFVKDYMLKFALFALAVAVGISRVYLICHFKEDVVLGSINGVFCASIAVYFYNFSISKNTSTLH